MTKLLLLDFNWTISTTKTLQLPDSSLGQNIHVERYKSFHIKIWWVAGGVLSSLAELCQEREQRNSMK